MERKNGTWGSSLNLRMAWRSKTPNSPSLVLVRLTRRLGVKTNSTLLQTTLRADFALPFAENEV
jgi:hypothetical protein